MTFEEWWEENLGADLEDDAKEACKRTSTYKAMKRAYEAGYSQRDKHDRI